MANPKLVILSEQLRGQTFELTADSYMIGRAEPADICIPEATISSRHCVLQRGEDGGYTAHDMGSTNGTRINGVRIEQQRLMSTDILQVGSVEILYDCEEESIHKGLSTQTKIDLEKTAGGVQAPELENLNPFQVGRRKSGSRTLKYVFIGVIVLLAIVVIALIIILVVNMFG